VAKAKKIVMRREYTNADVKELRAHSKAKTPVAKIAKLTKRTEGSLRQKAIKLGIRLGHRRWVRCSSETNENAVAKRNLI
jgi:hypothetical protein